MKKILLLGGTGAIGRALVDTLKEENEVEIYVTSRKGHESKDNIFYFEGDAHNLVFLNSVINRIHNIDVIVDFMVWNTSDFLNIFKTILNNCGRYIYLSSARVYDNSEELIKEDSKKLYDTKKDRYFLSHDTYAVPKTQQEQLLIKSEFNNYVIIRPYITYGDNRIPFLDLEKEIWLYRIMKGRTLVISKDILDCYTSMIFSSDCAKAISCIMNSPNCENEVITISTKEYMRWYSVFQIYETVLYKHGMRINVKCIPNSIKGSNGDFQTLFDRKFNRRFDVEKLSKYSDVTQFKDMSSGLAESLNSFLENPRFIDDLQDWRTQAQMDKICHEFADRNEFSTKETFYIYLLYRLTPISFFKRIAKKCICNIYNLIYYLRINGFK